MNKMYALGRLPAGTMNKTEKRFSEYLDLHRSTFMKWWFEPVALRLAKKTSYTPDFMAFKCDGEIVFFEVKGFWTSTARVKVKIAAEKFPFKFVIVKLVKGGWTFEEVI